MFVNSGPGIDNEWWGPLLEKAYCKFNVACTYLNLGSSLESFRALTGMPTVYHRISRQTDEEFLNVINEVHAKKWMSVAGTKNEKYGIVARHAYTILDTHLLDNTDNKYPCPENEEGVREEWCSG